MKLHHKYSISEVEEMVPYERDWYIRLIMQHQREKNNPPPTGDGQENDGGYSAMLDELKSRQARQKQG